MVYVIGIVGAVFMLSCAVARGAHPARTILCIVFLSVFVGGMVHEIDDDSCINYKRKEGCQ